jgi:Uma2 family endonuclease
MKLYARYGVKECWIGDAAKCSLEILTLKEGRYELHGAAAERGKLNSLVLTGLSFDVAEIQG